MIKIKRVWILSLLAAASLATFAWYLWYDSQQIKYSDLAVHCREMSCRYEMKLKNPGPLQGAQFIWVAHKVTQDKGDIISWITKNTEEVAGEKVYMTASSQRTVSGVFRKPQHTSYVVLKLRPVE